MTDKEDIKVAFSNFLEKHLGEVPTEAPTAPVKGVKKAVDVEHRKALFIVLEPTTEASPDLHGDVYTSVEVEKAADNFNRFCGQANVQHSVDTENAVILESYVTPVEFTLDTGKIIQKSSWVQNWFFPETDEGEVLWQGVKDGTFTGLSIGCTATTEVI